MLACLKAEFRKLLTVRSTYFLTAFVLALVAFLSIYVFGYQEASQPTKNPLAVTETLYGALGMFVTFGAIVSILLMAHEYRYNLINYTLTASRSRLQVLASKAIVVLAYGTVIGFAVVAITYFGFKLGVDLKGKELIAQDLSFIDLLWRYTAYVWAYMLVGLLLAVLLRAVVAAIVTFFVFPVIEQLLTLILKDKSDYLPFRSLDAVGSNSFAGEQLSRLQPAEALGVFSIYLIVIGIVAVVLFNRRDAS